jgi:hypothetical protein
MSLHYKMKNGQYILEKDGVTPKLTLGSKIRWNLFGETKIFFWWFAVTITMAILFWGTIGWVAFHFIHKYW